MYCLLRAHDCAYLQSSKTELDDRKSTCSSRTDGCSLEIARKALYTFLWLLGFLLILSGVISLVSLTLSTLRSRPSLCSDGVEFVPSNMHMTFCPEQRASFEAFFDECRHLYIAKSWAFLECPSQVGVYFVMFG